MRCPVTENGRILNIPHKKNFIIPIIVLALLSFAISFYWIEEELLCEACGGCSYTKGQQIVYIESFEMDNNHLKSVHFQSVFSSKNRFWYARNFQLEHIGIHLDSATVSDTSIRFILEGEFINHGTCVPFSFRNLKRIP
ncbi:hypothetical protein N9L43_00030 [bacterium]|nr:hypothetical protein [bacterium]